MSAAAEDIKIFRTRADKWLAANAPQDRLDFESPADELVAARQFLAAAHDAGFAAISWPVRYGGQGLTVAHERAYKEAAAAYAPPTDLFLIGLAIVAPTILALGTPDQKQLYLRALGRGEVFWCQLFSEPEAGSDVAGLRTRATRHRDGWLLNGQKVWTTHAQLADFGLLLARTDPDLPKHRGLTMFILDMNSAGVRVRPLRDMTGGARFNEVFLDDVYVPGDRVLGEVNGGWAAAVRMLSFERIAIGERIRPRSHAVSFVMLARAAAERGLLDDGFVQGSLLDLYIRERQTEVFSGGLVEQIRAGIDPGARGSVGKLLNAQLAECGVETAQAVLGPGSVFWADGDDRGERTALAISEKHSWSIAGGTSEIQRTIIGEQILGLPKEPQVDRGIPFRQLASRDGKSPQ